METVRSRRKVEIIKKDDNERKTKQESKIAFNGIHESYKNYDSYTFKQNEVLMDKPIYLGFVILELGKLLIYETFYDNIQPYFRQEIYLLHIYGLC